MLLLAVATQGHIMQHAMCCTGHQALICRTLLPHADRVLHSSQPQWRTRRANVLHMMARKKAVPVEDEDDELVVQDEDDTERIQMVNAMTTSLGYEEELKPFPGPNVAEEEREVRYLPRSTVSLP